MQQQTKFSLLNECFLHYFTVCMTVSILVFPSACVKGTCVELCSLFLFLRPCLHLILRWVLVDWITCGWH